MSNLKVNTINDANGGSAAVLYGVASPPNSMGFRNRIINGDMRIAQRGTAAVSADGSFPIDRWLAFRQAGAFSAQQSTDVPTGAGFTNSIVWSPGVTTATTYSGFEQRIEGFNVSDLDWGTASAKAVTISFWVKAGVTATLSVTAANGAGNRNYPATYTINTANTWEFKTITIPGDTSGTWLKDNGAGLRLWFTSGGTLQQAGNAWGSGSSAYCATGTTALYAASANLWITGVQLEAGTVASPFERRDIGRELMMCQRYYQAQQLGAIGYGPAGQNVMVWAVLPVILRASPTAAQLSNSGPYSQVNVTSNTSNYAGGNSYISAYRTISTTGFGQFFELIALSAEL